MKKTIGTLLLSVQTDASGKLEGGFAGIKGGMNLNRLSQNSTCDNGECNGSDNSGTCNNTGICEDATNRGPQTCTNTLSCAF
jgi:hypothetical protein